MFVPSGSASTRRGMSPARPARTLGGVNGVTDCERIGDGWLEWTEPENMGKEINLPGMTALGLGLDFNETLLGAIALGFTSVMYDGGDLPFEANVAATSRSPAVGSASGSRTMSAER